MKQLRMKQLTVRMKQLAVNCKMKRLTKCHRLSI
jgi:hypothetical protein